MQTALELKRGKILIRTNAKDGGESLRRGGNGTGKGGTTP